MKNTKINFALIVTVIAAGTCLVADAVKKTKEKLYRLAAGESDYERTHRKK